jgi:peptidoglycan hydrolase-like protein with peptidoglycan-binding domain
MLIRGRAVFIALAAIFWVCLSLAPVQASTAIYYSVQDNIYGWCAGYAYDRAHTCAHDECTKQGGKDCQLALECDGGWGAIAFGNEPAVAVGATCGLKDAYFARSQALAACMNVANTLCATDTTFDGNGQNTTTASNHDFDLTWLAQAMLQIRNFKLQNADGEMGIETRTAIKKFQTALRETPTGIADQTLIDRLLDAVEGPQEFASIIKRDVLDARHADLGDLTYAHAASPIPLMGFSQDLMQRSDEQRRTALATILSDEGSPCTLPAKDAEPLPDAKSGVWNIGCVEGDYTLMMTGDGQTVITTGKSTMTPDSKTAASPDDNGGGNGKNLTAAH